MSLSTILLKTGQVPTADPTAAIYSPSATEPKKVAIVQSMRFANTGANTAKLRVWFQKGGGNFSAAAARRILPFDQPLPPGYALIEDSELTLGSGDGIYFQSDTGSVEFVLSGTEKDVS